jgi:hypothetical protein
VPLLLQGPNGPKEKPNVGRELEPGVREFVKRDVATSRSRAARVPVGHNALDNYLETKSVVTQLA